MKFKTILLGTAALALMAGPAGAQDAPKKHHHHVEHAAGTSSIDARIDELEQEIHELKAAQVQAQAAPAPSDAVSQAQFEALQNQVYEQQASTQSLTKSSWWANTKIGGRIFWDISNIDAKASTAGVPGSTKTNQSGLNYDIKRAYLIIDHKFNDVWSANITTDVTYDGTTKASQLFLKKAYVAAAFAPEFTVRVGAADLPWVPFVEGIYGYRYVENVLTDRTKFATSTDWGAHILGTFDLGGPTLGYAFSAVNGFGYKLAPIGAGASNPSTTPSNTNRGKGIDFEGRVNLNWDGFVAAVGGYDGKLGNSLEDSALTDVHTATRFDALVAYTTDEFRIGGEYFSATNYKSVTAVKGTRADGYSAFASWQFDSMWSVFGRYDWVKPTNALTAGKKQTNEYYNLGVSYSPIKQLDFALVYKHDGVDNGSFSDSEFNDLAGTTHATYNEIGIFGQVNF